MYLRFELVGFAAIVLLGAVSVGIALSMFKSSEQTQLAVSNSYARADRLNETFSLLQDVDIGQRGYIITQNEEFLQPYFAAEAIVASRIIEMNASADPEQRLLGELIKAKLEYTAASISLNRRQGQEVAITRSNTGVGKQLMDRVRSQRKKLIGREREYLAERTVLNGKATNRAILTIILLLVAAFLLSFGISFRLRAAERELQASVARLHSALDNVTVGIALLDTDGQIVERNDRLGELLNPGQNPGGPVRLGGAELAGLRARQPFLLERVVGDDVVIEVHGHPADLGLYVLTYTDGHLEECRFWPEAGGLTG